MTCGEPKEEEPPQIMGQQGASEEARRQNCQPCEGLKEESSSQRVNRHRAEVEMGLADFRKKKD